MPDVLSQHCGLVATDSGSVQQDAFLRGRHCVTSRGSTEWIKRLEQKLSVFVQADAASIEREGIARLEVVVENDGSLYGGVGAGPEIARFIGEA
ncbi:UDP-N-acetylglucosamine 2-epimerase [Thalassococcus sp. BH17M4-6]|uniref:UDP-N-acetylglucosamine 2-epimerase n=1 Tax=Thalassococcus sp. BH17M4-6 TaxID=3413148 RepID=UPI003BEC42A7